MAVTDWNRITAISREKILPGMGDSIVKDHPVLSRLFGKAKKADGGHRIDKIIRYANSTQGGFYTGLDTLNTSRDDYATRASFDWRQFHIPVAVSNIDIFKNGGEGKILDYLGEEMENVRKSMLDRFATALYTAQSGKAIDSLVDVCDDSTNVDSYGGIPRSTYTWWKGNYTAAAGSITLSLLDTAYRACKSGNKKPTLMVTDEATHYYYEALLEPQRRYTDSKKADPKFDALMYGGTPVMSDEYCTSGYMYLLNEDTVEVAVANKVGDGTPTNNMGFGFTDFREPTDQDGKVAYFLWYGNVYCIEPRKNGVIRGLTA